MSERHPPEGSAVEAKVDEMSVREILALALQFEHNAACFYRGLGDRVSKPIRQLAAELADEEEHHYALLRELADRVDIEEQIGAIVRTPVSDHRFSDYIQLPELGERPDDQDILRYALGREQAALNQYRALADNTQPGPVNALFRYLADEELRHKGELEKRYYALVHGGP